jgi:hypothetical protein
MKPHDVGMVQRFQEIGFIIDDFLEVLLELTLDIHFNGTGLMVLFIKGLKDFSERPKTQKGLELIGSVLEVLVEVRDFFEAIGRGRKRHLIEIRVENVL